MTSRPADGWTVGQLRAALAGLPDGASVRVLPAAEEPTGAYGPVQVLAAVEQLTVDVPAGPTGATVALVCDLARDEEDRG